VELNRVSMSNGNRRTTPTLTLSGRASIPTDKGKEFLLILEEIHAEAQRLATPVNLVNLKEHQSYVDIKVIHRKSSRSVSPKSPGTDTEYTKRIDYHDS
jgi:hypothetical protein